MSTYVIGRLFEEALALNRGGEVLPLSTGEGYCPDVKINPTLYAECKSVGRSSRAILYENRIKREREWCKRHNTKLLYYFFRHNVNTKKIRGRAKLRRELIKSCEIMVRLSAEQVYEVVRYVPSRIINPANPEGYQRGWLIKFEDLRKLCTDPGHFKANFGKEGTLIAECWFKFPF